MEKLFKRGGMYMKKSKVENLLKKYKKYWGDYRRYLQSNDEYIELLVKNNVSKKEFRKRNNTIIV